jgi:YHS domain-containing protein
MPQSYRNPIVATPPATAAAPAVTSTAIAGAVTNPYTGVNPTTPPGLAGAAATVAAAQPPAGPPPGTAIQPAQPPLPADCPPVAFDGCCPVTLKTLNQWAPGSTAFGCVHRGRTYLFVGEKERQQFWADPDAYSPVFAGYDPVLLLEKQQSVPGSRKFGFRYGGAFYLFASADTMAKFEASPHTYAAGVRQAMARVDARAGDVIRR